MTSSQWREEAVGCPGPTRFLDALENIFYSFREISDDLFLSVVKFIKICSLEAPSRASSCPGNDIFSSFFAISLLFLQKMTPWMPPVWMPGAVEPSAPPLPATASSSCTSWAYCCVQCTACDCCVL